MNVAPIYAKPAQVLLQELAALRALVVTPAALLATFFLLWGMERLITADEDTVLMEPEVYKVPNPVLDEPPPIEILYQRPEPPQPVELEPEPPQLEVALAEEPSSFLPLAPAAPPRSDADLSEFFGDEPVATMLVQPVYPAAAASKGVEGYVDVKFDISATGATENIQVVSAVPPKIFERETIKAVKRWKFNPVIRDGKPIPYRGMAQRIHFEMEKK